MQTSDHAQKIVEPIFRLVYAITMDSLLKTDRIEPVAERGGQGVEARLRAYIAERHANGETRLPPERTLASQMEVSRSSLRKAFTELEADGLIWRHVGQGTFIGKHRPASDETIRLASADTNPAEVMDVRLILEPRIAALAAVNASQFSLVEMSRCLKKSTGDLPTPVFEHWDGLLHRAIALSARNALLLSIFDAVNAVREQTHWGQMKQTSVTPERMATYQHQHRDLVEAISARDAEAAAHAMASHLKLVRRHLLGGGSFDMSSNEV